MKLRFKLILAFLLLSVVPLSGVIVYSYVSSQRAVRRAVESEAQMMADEMGRRLEGVRNDLNRQMDRLSQFPFRRFLGGKGLSPDLQKDPVFAELMKRMGEDDDVLFESLEFVRHPPAPPEPHGPELKARPSAKPHKAPPSEPPMVIFLSRLFERSGLRPPRAATPPESPPPGPELGMDRFPRPPGPPPPGEAGRNAPIQAEVAARFAAEMVHKKAAALHKVMESWGQLTEAERTALEEKRKQMKLLLGREFGS